MAKSIVTVRRADQKYSTLTNTILYNYKMHIFSLACMVELILQNPPDCLREHVFFIFFRGGGGEGVRGHARTPIDL